MSLAEPSENFADIKKLNIKELKTLSNKVRSKIIQTVTKNGGHLSSSLGVVELTVALYHVFDFPKDKLIFDVGHQCYAHKILSNRGDFETLRTVNGLSGFPCREESGFDAFSTGHAGTSLSAGIGLCNARDKLNQDYSVISIIGDGSFVNGLNLEALTSSNGKPHNLIVIFNDNGMSIAENKNGLYNLLSKGTTKGWYLSNKRVIKKLFGESFVTRGLRRFRDFWKRALNKNIYVDKFGFKYVGLTDGHDMAELISVLKDVKNTAKSRAVFLHVKTTKGKGLDVAEAHSDIYHGVGKNLETENGEFSCALGYSLSSLMDKDEKIIAITAAMKDGTGLSRVEKDHPDAFIDVGIAEEYAVTLAGGMAAGGLKPVVAIYSTFLQRAYDQILHDVCLQNLPVVFCLDRAGFVGADGRTHQGLFDLSYLSHMPNLTILAPANTSELKNMLEYALSLNSPVALRYPKNNAFNYKSNAHVSLWEEVGESQDNPKLTLLAVGPRMLRLAFEIKELLGVSARIVNARSVKPLDEKMLDLIKGELIVTLEENSVIGGFASACERYYSLKGEGISLMPFGAKDEFCKHGTVDWQLKKNGLDAREIAKKIRLRMINLG